MRHDVVERARAGDRESFDLLAASVVDRLYAIARLILRDTDRAEDAVQEALVACWRDLPSLRQVDRFDGWLNRVLMHAISKELRSARRHRAAITLLRIEPATADPSGRLVARELLDRAFSRLSPDHRAVLVLRLYLGLSIEETAHTIGIPVGTTKSRLHYATEAMRLALQADASPQASEVTA